MLKRSLLARTALAGILAAHPCLALAADVTVSSGQTLGTQALTSGQSLTVNSGGTVTASGSTATVTQSGTSGNPTAAITNSGTISATGSARTIDINDNTSQRTLSITNNGTITSSANDTVRVGKNLAAGSQVTITNSGTIQAGGTGYAGLGQAIDLRSITNAGTLTLNNNVGGVIEALTDDAVRPGTNATINNSGTIRSYGANTSGGANGTADGIDAGSILGVTVNNQSTGVISGARHGVTADSNITVNNWGTITGRNGSGVGSDGNGTVVNYGTISGDYAGVGNIFNSDGTASTNGDGDGVDIDGTASITNYGTIRGTGAGGVDSGGRTNHSEAIAAGGGSIDNKAGGVVYGADAGILVDDGAGGSGVAATTITNAGTIEGAQSYAIKLVGTFNDTLTNNGGTIKAVGGLAVDMGAGNDTVIINGGTISGGSIEGGDGTDKLYFYSSGSGTFIFDNAITNFEETYANGGKVVLRGALGSSSLVTVASGAQLQINQAFSTGTLTVNGTLLAPENAATRTASVTNYVQGASGVLELRVNSSADYDKVAATGTASVADGATIRPVITAYIANGTTLRVLTSAGLTATADGITLDYTSPLLSWVLSKDGNDLVMTATRTTTFAAATGGTSSSAATVLEQMGSVATGDMQTVIAAVQNQGSLAAVGSAVQQLAPTPSGGALQGTQATGAGMVNSVQTRMAALRNGQGGQTALAESFSDPMALTQSGRALASVVSKTGDDDPMGPLLGVVTGPGAAQAGIWSQGFGGSGDQKARGDSQGYTSHTAGFAFGADTVVDDDTMVGFAGSYARSYVDGRGTQDQDRTRVNSYQLTAYGTRSFGDAFIEGVASIGVNAYDSKRVITVLDRTANADYHGWQGLAKITAGHAFPAGAITVTPVTSLQYTHTHLGAYSETGAGAASLAVEAQNYNTLTPGIGVRLGLTAPLPVAEGLLAPQFNINLTYDVISDRQSVNSAFTGGGSAFTTQGAEPARTGFNTGLGLAYRQDDTEISVGYQLDLRDQYIGHGAVLRLRHDL